jgi:hypothetical protein
MHLIGAAASDVESTAMRLLLVKICCCRLYMATRSLHTALHKDALQTTLLLCALLSLPAAGGRVVTNAAGNTFYSNPSQRTASEECTDVQPDERFTCEQQVRGVCFCVLSGFLLLLPVTCVCCSELAAFY